MKETPIVKEIQLALSHGEARLFRNNVGEAWQGKAASHPYIPRAIILHEARRVNFGLCTGSPDLVGFKSVTITPEMVGQKIAVFSAVEVKPPAGYAGKLQRAWLEMASGAGGYVGTARSVDEARAILRL